MCRRYFFWAGILIAFGSGLLFSLLLDSSLLRLILGGVFVVGGLCLLKR